MTSYKPEVETAGDPGKWSGNACRFASEQEAQDYVSNLGYRWSSVTDTRVVESDDPVNYRWHPEYGAQAIVPAHPLSTSDKA